jgi:hypothetical protein
MLLLLAGCMPDNCTDNLCVNGGVCVDGNCSCLNGYEGTHCDEVWHKRFLGKWQAKERFQGNPKQRVYPVTLLSAGRPDQFWLINLGNRKDTVVCSRKTYLEFSIAGRRLKDTTISIKSGSGHMDTTQDIIIASYSLQLSDTTINYLLELNRPQ